MTMTTLDLVKEFCNGGTVGSASNKRLRIEGNKLVNYSTVIALRVEGGIILNSTKYSPTTSKHQNRIRQYGNVIKEIEEEKLYRML